MAWCLFWWFASNRKKHGHTWHPNSLLKPGVIKQHKTQASHCANSLTMITLLRWLGFVPSMWKYALSILSPAPGMCDQWWPPANTNKPEKWSCRQDVIFSQLMIAFPGTSWLFVRLQAVLSCGTRLPWEWLWLTSKEVTYIVWYQYGLFWAALLYVSYCYCLWNSLFLAVLSYGTLLIEDGYNQLQSMDGQVTYIVWYQNGLFWAAPVYIVKRLKFVAWIFHGIVQPGNSRACNFRVFFEDANNAKISSTRSISVSQNPTWNVCGTPCFWLIFSWYFVSCVYLACGWI